MIPSEEFNTSTEARKKELYWKSGGDRRRLRIILGELWPISPNSKIVYTINYMFRDIKSRLTLSMLTGISLGFFVFKLLPIYYNAINYSIIWSMAIGFLFVYILFKLSSRSGLLLPVLLAGLWCFYITPFGYWVGLRGPTNYSECIEVGGITNKNQPRFADYCSYKGKTFFGGNF